MKENLHSKKKRRIFMKTKNYLTLKNLLNAMNLEDDTRIELYNKSGEIYEFNSKEIDDKFLEKSVLKYKQDNSIPNIHIKLNI
jgi:hypothetical protein